jgi:hypothetical protein
MALISPLQAEDYTKEEQLEVLGVLTKNWIRTVHNLRVLTKPRIDALGLPPAVTEYLIRVAGHK